MENLNWKADRIEQLERTILELGTELYRLKSDISSVRSSHSNFLEVMKGLKLILDEKGLINVEDFESAIDLGAAIANVASNHDYSIHEEIEKIKKTSH